MTRKAGSTDDGGSFVPARDDGRVRVNGREVRTWQTDGQVKCSFASLGRCDNRGDVGSVFVDGATSLGPWACMCAKCYRRYGMGLGLGRGQRYEWVRCDDGVSRWVKVL